MATMRVIPPFPASNSPKKETAWRSSFLPFVCRVPLAGTFWLENRARARERKAPRPRNVGVLRWSLEVHGQRQIERVEQHRVFASKLEAERAKRRATIEVVSELLEARMEDGVSELPSPAQREPRLSIVTRSSADSKEMISARASFSVPSHLEFAVNKVLNFDRYTKLATRMFKVRVAPFRSSSFLSLFPPSLSRFLSFSLPARFPSPGLPCEMLVVLTVAFSRRFARA